MSKAYDKVQFKILLNKLYGIGIRGKSYKWFESYLKDREQFVEIEHFDHNTKEIKTIRSDGKFCNASIPQGSVIGCLLFIIYINDLPKIIEDPCVLFADDMSLLTSSNNNSNSQIKCKLQSIIDKTSVWMAEHNLEINYSKTKIISFHPYKKKPLNIKLSYNNIKLEQVNEFSLLGLIIDTNINWKSHIQKIRSKLASFSYALREVKKTTDIPTALSTYYAYAYSWLSYGVIMWGNSTNAPDLLILQKKLVRIIFNIQNTDSCKPYFVEHNILTLPCIYILETCKFVKKYPEFYKKRGDINVKYKLRHRQKLLMPTSHLELFSSGPLSMSIKIFNKLPDSIKCIKKEKPFINKLKEFLISKHYYTLSEYFNDKS